MARKFREVERGWTDSAGVVEVQRTAVDNAESNWDVCFDGADLASSDDTQLVTERNLDFYVERLVCHYQPYAIPTALNTAGYVDMCCGLAIIDSATGFRNDIPVVFTTNPFWSSNMRAAAEYHRLLRLRFHRAVARSIDKTENDEASYVAPSAGYFEFDVKNLFLKEDETVVFWVSQVGISDEFLPWSTSDIAGASWMTQSLIRKKQGR